MNKSPFLKVALQDHKVAALGPSSRFAVRQVLKALPEHCKVIVEYGAGDGVMTKALLEQLPPTGKLFAIETNPTFIGLLNEIADPRLVVLPNNVLDIVNSFDQQGINHADAVVSGIPFSFFSKQQRKQIVQLTHQLLSATGKFIVYQVTPLMFPYLKKQFGKRTSLAIEPRNLPPYFIMVGRK